MTPPGTSAAPPAAAPRAERAGVRLREYLLLGEVPWSLAYVGFVTFVVVTTTYVLDIGLIAMALAWVGLLFGRTRIRWPRPFWLLFIFWLWAALSTLTTDYAGTYQGLIDLGKIILVFLMAVNVLHHRLALQNFLLLFILCFSLFPARGTLSNYYIHQSADFGRPHWIQLFGNANDLGALCLLALAVALGFLHKEAPRVVRFGAICASLVLPFIVLLTQSRAAFLGMSVFALLVFLSMKKRRLRALAALGAIGIVVVSLAPTDVWDRIAGLRYGASAETIDQIDPEGSAAQRWAIWQTSLQIISDRPVLGVGLDRYQRANLAYNPKLGPRDVHNTFLEVLAETGVPGLLLFLATLFTILVRARNARREAAALQDSAQWRRLQFLEIGLLAYLTAGIWGTYGFLSMFYIYLAMVVAQTEMLRQAAAEARGAAPGGATATQA